LLSSREVNRRAYSYLFVIEERGERGGEKKRERGKGGKRRGKRRGKKQFLAIATRTMCKHNNNNEREMKMTCSLQH
jgi:hypothetical protein